MPLIWSAKGNFLNNSLKDSLHNTHYQLDGVKGHFMVFSAAFSLKPADIACCCSPTIYFLLPLLLHLGVKGGCLNLSRLSRGGGGVTTWTSGCFVTGPQGQTNSRPHSRSTLPHNLELSVNQCCAWTFEGSGGEGVKLKGLW